jgi:hypothetical protein
MDVSDILTVAQFALWVYDSHSVRQWDCGYLQVYVW